MKSITPTNFSRISKLGAESGISLLVWHDQNATTMQSERSHDRRMHVHGASAQYIISDLDILLKESCRIVAVPVSVKQITGWKFRLVT